MHIRSYNLLNGGSFGRWKGDIRDSSYSNIPMTSYELPDGQTKKLVQTVSRFLTPLFNPSLVRTIPGMESFAESAASLRSLPQMVIESINRSDVDIRRELYSSILLAGGTASMQQLKERLEKDLLEESPQAARVKVLASGNATERRFRYEKTWSSVFSQRNVLNLHQFQQQWQHGYQPGTAIPANPIIPLFDGTTA
nr:actin-related protein 4-like [Ipomoea batatas]